jgi:hypothetical protein
VFSFHIRLVAAVVVATALFAGWAAVPAPGASAASPRDPDCAQAIIDDWYGDGQIDGSYPKGCYREAIRSLPNDTKDYTHASDDILRALAYRNRGLPDPGSGGSGGQLSAALSHPPGFPPTSGTQSLAAGQGDDLGGSSGSSVPIPLLVLGGCAVMLLGAGGVGYVSRRLGSRRTGGDAS